MNNTKKSITATCVVLGGIASYLLYDSMRNTAYVSCTDKIIDQMNNKNITDDYKKDIADKAISKFSNADAISLESTLDTYMLTGNVYFSNDDFIEGLEADRAALALYNKFIINNKGITDSAKTKIAKGINLTGMLFDMDDFESIPVGDKKVTRLNEDTRTDLPYKTDIVNLGVSGSEGPKALVKINPVQEFTVSMVNSYK